MIDKVTKKEGGDMSIEDYSGRIFWFAFGLIPIFGLPAVAAVLLGKFLDNFFGSGLYGTVGLLAIAFVFSWFIVIRQYIIFNREWQAKRPGKKI